MALLVLNRNDIEQCLTISECIEILRSAMVTANSADTKLPLRSVFGFGTDRALGVMPGYIPNPACFGAKLTALFPGHFGSGISSHEGVVTLFDAIRGVPIAILHGAQLTAMRTAAASALATDLLSRKDSRILAILGYGEQALWHLRSIATIRRFERILIWGRSRERAQTFCCRADPAIAKTVEIARTAEEAVRAADILCTTTAAVEPIVDGKWIRPGTHLNLVGSSVPTAREVDDETVIRSRFFVDYRPSAEAQAGEYRSALASGRIRSDHLLGSIGEVIDGSVIGRESGSDITAYKSLGIAAQDLATAWFVVEKARRMKLGTAVEF